MALFGKSEKRRERDRQRLEEIQWGFDMREIGEGRTRHYDKERQAWRARRMTGSWESGGHWVDDGPFDSHGYNRRFQQWLAGAADDPTFELQVRAAAAATAESGMSPIEHMAQQFDRTAQEEAARQ